VACKTKTSEKMSNSHGMNWISKPSRLAIYLRDNLCCCYCGSTLEDGIKLTLDHLTTRSNGGNNKPENLITACHKCNSNRGDRDLVEFVNSVAQYINHGVTGTMILNHINACVNKDLKEYRKLAREIINSRPTWADALKAANGD
jgi:hypothetical protein